MLLKRVLVLIWLVIGIVGSLISSEKLKQETPASGQVLSQESANANTDLYEVTKIVDGDTIRVKKNEQEVKVRLIGIDTPETVDPRKEVECYGVEAKEYLGKLLSGKSVKIETDPSQDTYDKYGRLLGYVYLNEELVNLKMIEGGYAHEYTYDLPYKFQAEFRSGEKVARENAIGLWSSATCPQS